MPNGQIIVEMKIEELAYACRHKIIGEWSVLMTKLALESLVL